MQSVLLTLVAVMTSAPAVGAEDSKGTPGDDAAKSTVHAELGGNYESGRYGSRRKTTVKSADATLDWDATESTTLSLHSSYLFQTAPAGSLAGRSRGGHIHRGAGPLVATTGVGDTVIGLDQYILQQSESIHADWGLRAEVKLGTADVHKGLGSGRTDYTAATYLGHDWGVVSGRAEIGYSVLGSPGIVTVNGSLEDVQYRNVWSSSLGVDFEFSKKAMLGFTFNAEQSPSVSVNDRTSPPSKELTADLSIHLTRTVKFKASALKGFTRTSPDWGAGVAVAIGY